MKEIVTEVVKEVVKLFLIIVGCFTVMAFIFNKAMARGYPVDTVAMEEVCKGVPSSVNNLCQEYMMMRTAITRTKVFEGYRSCAYRDGEGWAIGFGQQIDQETAESGICITKKQADELIQNRYLYNYKHLVKFPGWNKHPPQVKMVLLDMAYNLGMPRLSKFRNTLKDIANGRYCQAGQRIMKSKYAKQVKRRAVENVNLLCHPEVFI